MTNPELSRAIALSGDEWIQPGIRVVDAETESLWRRIGATWGCEGGGNWFPDGVGIAKNRAIAAGPDLSDSATVGVLLGLMPDLVSIGRRMPAGTPRGCGLWSVIYRPEGGVPAQFFRVDGSTRAEAIARAFLASKRCFHE